MHNKFLFVFCSFRFLLRLFFFSCVRVCLFTRAEHRVSFDASLLKCPLYRRIFFAHMQSLLQITFMYISITCTSYVLCECVCVCHTSGYIFVFFVQIYLCDFICCWTIHINERTNTRITLWFCCCCCVLCLAIVAISTLLLSLSLHEKPSCCILCSLCLHKFKYNKSVKKKKKKWKKYYTRLNSRSALVLFVYNCGDSL